MKKRWHAPGPSGCDAPTANQTNDIDGAGAQLVRKSKHVCSRGGGKATLLAALALFLLSVQKNALGTVPSNRSDDMSRYGPPSNSSNKFISQFEDSLLHDLGHGFVPLVYDDGKLLCRRKHRRQLSKYRTRFFSQMVRTGLPLQNHTSIDVDGGLPLLIMDGDENGCNVQMHRDDQRIPRLSWSMLTPKHGDCAAIGMPSYETWKYYHRSHKTEQSWERTFQQNERRYPWTSKINKAVWRGSTTYEGSQYHDSALGETPRGKLVSKSMEHPESIDAGFHKIIQKFLSQKHELKEQFTVAKRIHPSGMMKYKAIIDIDGNNWSSRFGMLLCSNSVVIKIDPDFIEYFYDEGGEVKPMVHYVPASLDNITEVVAYVMDKKNEDEMRAIVMAANSWCKGSLSEMGLGRDAVLQLEAYKEALDSYDKRWTDEWRGVKQRFAHTLDDLVECNAWSIIDPFTFPMFAGL